MSPACSTFGGKVNEFIKRVLEAIKTGSHMAHLMLVYVEEHDRRDKAAAFRRYQMTSEMGSCFGQMLV